MASTAGITTASTATTKRTWNCCRPATGAQVKFQDSPQLCGSCHGPTYEDWEAGAHGRISGYWDRSLGPIKRQDCVNCHNPHSPHVSRPGTRRPGPHLLHELAEAPARADTAH